MAIIGHDPSSSHSSSRSSSLGSFLVSIFVALCLLFIPRASSDVASDRAQCADQLVGLATCLTYVQGGAKAPTPDCCAGLKEVVAKSPKCLCLLVKDHGDPQLGVEINVTLALALPAACRVPANVSECPKLLNLPPNSSEAEVFKQNGSPSEVKSNSTASPTANGGAGKGEKSSGTSNHLRWIKGWPTTTTTMADVVVVVGSLLLMAVPFLFFPY